MYITVGRRKESKSQPRIWQKVAPPIVAIPTLLTIPSPVEECPELRPPVTLTLTANINVNSNIVASAQLVERRVSRWMTNKLMTKLPVADTIKRTLIDLEQATSQPDPLYPLPADHLLTLVYYNVLRAFVSNTYLLGLEPDIMCHPVPSSFTTNNREISTLRLPQDLYPTPLQKTKPHHPYIDIFPSAAVRDNLLRAGDNFDDIELWKDVIGVHQTGTPSSKTYGMIVWGEPWNISSWEIGEDLARKWPWMLQGCHDLIHSTNFWREKRDENPIII